MPKISPRARLLFLSIGSILIFVLMPTLLYGQDEQPSETTPIFIQQLQRLCYYLDNSFIGHVLIGALSAIPGALIGFLVSDRAKEVRKWILGIAGAVAIILAIYSSENASMVIGFLTGIASMYMKFRDPVAPTEKKKTFGSAEWADKAHLDKHKMIGKAGIRLGSFEHTNGQRFYLHYTGDRHLLTVAPTRTGKGVSAIIPNLLTYTGSVVVIDPKGENALITADRRGKGTATIPGLGQAVHVVDPWHITGIPAARFNPLDWLQADDPDIAENAAMLADSIIVGSSGNDPFWDEEAKSLLTGILLYVALEEDDPEKRNLGYVRDLIVQGEDDFLRLLVDMGDSENHIVCSTGERTHAKDPKLLSSVLASLQSHTHFLDMPRLRESLSRSDFSFADLKAGGMSVYLVLPADRIGTFHRWLRLLIQQALTVNARNIDRQPPEKPVLFILDEMASLGRLTMLEQAYGLMAGFGIQLWGIVQDLSQLEGLYRNSWQTFVSNSGVLQYFGSRDRKTAEYFSALSGMQTIEKTSLSRSITEAANGGSNSTSASYDTVQRPLMFADELMMLRDQQQILLVENFNPVQGYRMPWFNDKELIPLGHNLRAERKASTAA